MSRPCATVVDLAVMNASFFSIPQQSTHLVVICPTHSLQQEDQCGNGASPYMCATIQENMATVQSRLQLCTIKKKQLKKKGGGGMAVTTGWLQQPQRCLCSSSMVSRS